MAPSPLLHLHCRLREEPVLNHSHRCMAIHRRRRPQHSERSLCAAASRRVGCRLSTAAARPPRAASGRVRPRQAASGRIRPHQAASGRVRPRQAASRSCAPARCVVCSHRAIARPLWLWLLLVGCMCLCVGVRRGSRCGGRTQPGRSPAVHAYSNTSGTSQRVLAISYMKREARG